MPEPLDVVVTEAAEKDIKRHRDVARVITRHLEQLATRPEAGTPLTGDLAGARSLKFSTASGEFRAVYIHSPERSRCIVFIIGPRGDVYEVARTRLRAIRAASAGAQ